MAEKITEAEISAISEKVNAEVEVKVKAMQTETNRVIAEKQAEAVKGFMSLEAFNEFKAEQVEKMNKELAKLEEVTKEQGNKINSIVEKAAPNSKSLEEFIISQGDAIKNLKKEGKGYMEFTAAQLKAAGVTSLSTSITNMTSPPGSPYLPGIGGPLEFFGIMRNPNYILNQVDLGSTNQARLAWVNETGDDGGTLTEIGEGDVKTLVSNTFQVETSTAKKMAAYVEITEEFEDDTPGLATEVRRLLVDRLSRGWDDVIQAAVIAVATAYSSPSMNGTVPYANFWDAVLAMITQVRVNNFEPNTVGMNPQTSMMMQADKTSVGDYLLPPFKDEIIRMLVQANKVPVYNAFVGDLKQFKVDVYKQPTLKIGWINDNFVRNKFCILNEVRYHRYISDNRKKAIVSGNLANVRALIDGGSGS